MTEARARRTSRTPAALAELILAARGRIALLAALDFCWFMVLPMTVWLLADSRLGAFIPIVAGVGFQVARLMARQKARRTLRLASMERAAQQALGKDTAIPEVLADSAFWGAHIAEYAASVDLPASAGAGLAVIATLALAGLRAGVVSVAQVGAVLISGVGLGVWSNRLRRPGANAIVDTRERTSIWMAAAVRDRGELASPKASAAFLRSIDDATASWCTAEDIVERARARHRFLIVFATGIALYVIARSNGLNPLVELPSSDHFSKILSGAVLFGASLPAAYALAAHLDSLAIANSELARLALKSGTRESRPGTPLEHPPSTLRARGLSVWHGQHLALALGDLELSLEHPIGIAGPNGSGKTTLATLIAGISNASEGEVSLDAIRAKDVDRDDVAFVPQDPVLIEPLSVLENLRLVAGEFEPQRALGVLRDLGLTCSLENPAGHLSRGEQRRIAIARALLKNPKLLVLDEPDAWLDVAGRRALLTTLMAAARTARVLIVSHRPDVLLQLETVIVLSADHRIEAVGAPADLRQSSATFHALLGEDSRGDPLPTV